MNQYDISLRLAYAEAESFLRSCGILDASVDAWILLEYVTGVSRASFLADREKKMSEAERDEFAMLVNRRGTHIPLQYLTGEQEFMGLPFLVNEHVLIPRQDTETLVELALCEMGKEQCRRQSDQLGAESPPYRVLDLCTGSGCIAISIARLWEQGYAGYEQKSAVQHRLKDSIRIQPEVYASDISEKALAVARENARRLDADIHFFQSDLFTQIAVPRCYFDMIVSNPPYIRTAVIEELSDEVRLHEPRTALDGGGDGLDFYGKIICESRAFLRQNGCLLLEIGYDQGVAVSELMFQNGFSDIRIAKDLAGNDRVASGYLEKADL